MTRNWRCVLIAAATAISAIAAAQEAAQQPAAAAPDIARGRQIATQVCAACHGADGNSVAPANPNLAAQVDDYITVQLVHFKQGVRVNPIMQSIAAPLSEADMRALGAYFSQQAPKGLGAKDSDLVKVGERIWRGGDRANDVPACAACHSPTGAGIPKNYPRLAGQYADYVYAQLKAFKSGARGADPGGKDVNGRIMVAIAGNMTDEQMKAVAEYAMGLREGGL